MISFKDSLQFLSELINSSHVKGLTIDAQLFNDRKKT